MFGFGFVVNSTLSSCLTHSKSCGFFCWKSSEINWTEYGS